MYFITRLVSARLSDLANVGTDQNFLFCRSHYNIKLITNVGRPTIRNQTNWRCVEHSQKRN